jgi:uncharacterized protein YcsI (UPF0317 family)
MSDTMLKTEPASSPATDVDRVESPVEARRLIRSGAHSGHTAAMAPGYMQGNLAILPAAYALDFARYCQRNPKPCPLVGVSDTGDPMLRTLGEDIDIRTDIGSYNVFRDGELVDQVTDIRELWRDDFVAFVLGCSYSFEDALLAEGVRLKHLETGAVVAMYYTSIKTVPAGAFAGPTVVSMRPMTTAHAIRAVEVTARFPHTHGTPVHLGRPELIGIDDILQPDQGDVPEIDDDEIPVFWACGVTPQLAVRAARPEICITHTPGSMLVTDLRSANARDGLPASRAA